MNHPAFRPAALRLARPPSARERVLAAATEALLGEQRAIPSTLVQRLLEALAATPRRGRPKRT